MSMNNDCPTCPKPKWVAFAVESEGNEPAPKKIKPGHLFHFTPAVKKEGDKEEVKPLDCLLWSGQVGEGAKEPKSPKHYKTMAAEVQVYLDVSPGYVAIECIKPK